MEAKQTWQRLSETERDKVFTLPLKELFESAASLTSGTRRQSMMLNHCLPASCCAVAIGKQSNVKQDLDMLSSLQDVSLYSN